MTSEFILGGHGGEEEEEGEGEGTSGSSSPSVPAVIKVRTCALA